MKMWNKFREYKSCVKMRYQITDILLYKNNLIQCYAAFNCGKNILTLSCSCCSYDLCHYDEKEIFYQPKMKEKKKNF